VESTSQVELPEGLVGPFQVFVNGVEQHPGTDFDRVGTKLVFRRDLAPEVRLGFWRWLSLFMGVAGTYRRNDAVDIVYTDGGNRRVLTLQPRASRDLDR
jgi:hypothetical protein